MCRLKIIVQFLLLALLFQVFCPVFLSVVINVEDVLAAPVKSTIHAEHHSCAIPQLIKEKEESDSKENEWNLELIPLIDFSRLSFVLTAYHTTRITPLSFHHRIDDHPPLFTLHSNFRI